MRRVRKSDDTHKRQFIGSGCTTLDSMAGRGWPLGLVVNVVGDESTGKTLLAIEAAANFIKKYPGGKVWYRESEAAFDKEYAESLGIPVSKIDFGRDNQIFETVEDIFEDLEKKVKWAMDNNTPGLYIVDSLDALSDREEQERKIDKASYGGSKPKQIGAMFRRLIRRIEASKICLFIISQTRDKIGVTFGQKKTRSGGKALNFYSAIILWMSHLETVYKTINKQKRAIGIRIKVRCTKNKVWKPHRQCEFLIRFNYGIDDLDACLNWLEEVGRLNDLDMEPKEVKRLMSNTDNLDDEEFERISRQASTVTKKAWKEIEKTFLPIRRKYQ